MKGALHILFRSAYLALIIFLGVYASLHWIHRSDWYKERLYRQLAAGDSEQRLRAASALAHYGGQKQLLAGLKSEEPAVRESARRALEYLWFNVAGTEAYQWTQTAFRSAEKAEYQEALAVLDRLIEKYPLYAEGWNRRASVYWQMGQYEKSIADCEQALLLNPHHYGAWQGIGICRLQLGDIAEACRCLRAALQIAPYDQATRDALQRCEALLRTFPHPGKPAKPIDLI